MRGSLRLFNLLCIDFQTKQIVVCFVVAAPAVAVASAAAVAAGALFKHKHASTVKSSQRKVVT